jgi:hypothetical protein
MRGYYVNVGTIIENFISKRNLWNILNNVKVIPNTNLEGYHIILIADFGKVAE